MPFAVGDKIHVEFEARVGTDSPTDEVSSCTLVRETGSNFDDGRWTHFVYLFSRVTSPRQAKVGDIIRVKFDAVITGEPNKGKYGTTQVREVTAGGSLLYTHYIFLRSASVTGPDAVPASNEDKAKGATTVPLSIGTKIHVKITSAVVGKKTVPTLSATNEIRQTDDGRWTHFLYLDSPFVTGNKIEGGIITAEFDARVAGPAQSAPNITTKVNEITLSGQFGFTHYVFLGSPAVTVTVGEPATPASRKGTTVSIDRYDTTIDRDDVESRIEELESGQEYDVVRVRNDEVLTSFEDEDDATQYIIDEDYDTERVQVRQQELDGDDAEELSNLRELANEVERYVSGSWTIYSSDFFDGEWARGEAIDTLNISRGELDDWPLSTIDWDDAADERRDYQYPNEFEFDGATFYGEEG